MKRVAVIGAGLGGLSAAIHLASRGYEVDIHEQAETIGGKAGTLELGGFRFDTGPSLLTMPFVIHDLFASAGRRSEDYLDMFRLPLLTRYFYEDGTIIDAQNDRAELLGELHGKTGEPIRSVERHLARAARLYDTTSGVFLFNSLGEISALMSRTALSALVRLPRIDARRTMHRANASAFRDPRLVQMFDRYATYNGSNPYRAPATLNIIAHVEHSLGGYAVRGGMRRLPEAIARLAVDTGVRILCGSPVQRILHHGGRVRGLRIEGEEHAYDIVISNADVHATYDRLLGDAHSMMAKRYRRAEPSSSAMVFFWGMNGRFPSLDVHNILFAADYRSEFAGLFGHGRIAGDPTVYIHISSKLAPADAPAGAENWFVMVNAPYDTGQDWDAEAERVRQGIIGKVRKLTGIDVESAVMEERVMTPRDIERRTGSHRGSIYGISSNSRFSAFLRQQARSRRYRGLYFCGGSAHPGGGIPLCILSGKIAADVISRHEG